MWYWNSGTLRFEDADPADYPERVSAVVQPNPALHTLAYVWDLKSPGRYPVETVDPLNGPGARHDPTIGVSAQYEDGGIWRAFTNGSVVKEDLHCADLEFVDGAGAVVVTVCKHD